MPQWRNGLPPHQMRLLVLRHHLLMRQSAFRKLPVLDSLSVRRYSPHRVAQSDRLHVVNHERHTSLSRRWAQLVHPLPDLLVLGQYAIALFQNASFLIDVCSCLIPPFIHPYKKSPSRFTLKGRHHVLPPFIYQLES